MEYSDRFESFWIQYKSRNKGPKRVAYTAWQRTCAAWCKEEKMPVTDEVAFSQHVMRGFEAVIKNRNAAERARHFVAPLPYVSTFLNQYRFEAEFEDSTGDLKRLQTEQVCDCGSGAVIGRNAGMGWICQECHLADWRMGEWHMAYVPTMKPALEATPKIKTETWREWSQRHLLTTDIGRAYLARIEARAT